MKYLVTINDVSKQIVKGVEVINCTDDFIVFYNNKGDKIFMCLINNIKTIMKLEDTL